MLKLAGETDTSREKIEAIYYDPGLPNTGDLEAATKTITATAEASGLGNADYSSALTLADPDDARLAVKRIASRLVVTIDSFDVATHLYCRVYVDAQDADHRLFDEDWTAIGEKLDAVDTHSGNKATIFNLLGDGQQHTFYFFFWVNQATNAVISQVVLSEAVGTCQTGTYYPYMELNHSGFLSMQGYVQRTGSGSKKLYVRSHALGNEWRRLAEWSDPIALLNGLVYGVTDICGKGSVATDIVYFADLYFVLRSEL